MKKTIVICLLLCVHYAQAQSTLDTLAITPAQWRGALAALSTADTLKCAQTSAKLYRSGRYRDEVIYQVKGKVFQLKEATILKWCARKEESNE